MASLTGVPIDALGYILIAFCITGIVTAGGKENLHLTLFMIGTLAAVILLPYTDGTRYLFNIMPIMLMYVAFGIVYIGKKLLKLGREPAENDIPEKAGSDVSLSTVGRVLACTLAFAVLALTSYMQIAKGIENITHWEEKELTDVYSDQAKEVYCYILDNIPEDEVVAFAKPRMLYLNTGHLSFRPGVNQHDLQEADYYLSSRLTFYNYTEMDLDQIENEIVLENQLFTLYKLSSNKNVEGLDSTSSLPSEEPVV